MKLYVYHNPNFLDRLVCGGMGLQLVAYLEGTLGDAFEKTNSIDRGWWENEDVIPLFEGNGCRSTSVSDIVIADDVAYECMPFGWEKHDHLTKWWNKMKKEKAEKLVAEKIAEIEELLLTGHYNTGNEVLPFPEAEEPWVFTFDEKDTVRDEDIPF